MLVHTSFSFAAFSLAFVFNARLHAQATALVSVASNGAPANSACYSAAVSGDGRLVVFESYATNLVPGDFNGTYDVFLRDQATGQTSRVSVGLLGADSDERSQHPSISSDGRFVVFESYATNLVPGDTNGVWDIFVRNRQTGTTTRVSVDSSGAQGNYDSGSQGSYSGTKTSDVSADGRYVAFYSAASNLVTGDTNGSVDIFVRDRQSATTERVSVATGGTEGNSLSENPSLSADGRFVAFESFASNLVAGDTNGFVDIFVRDRQGGTTERVSVAMSGAEGNSDSGSPSISADGRYVAFSSYATNLVPGDTNGVRDTFVHDRQTGATTRVSVDSMGVEGTGSSVSPATSADGRFVAFYSDASNLVAGDSNARTDIFVHDRQTGVTERASVDSGGAQANRDSYYPSISADGRYVAFGSTASNLVPGDTNGVEDVFIRDWFRSCHSDADSDGFGDPQVAFASPSACGTGYVENDLDCDDSNSAVHPGATDICNGVDDDCDGTIDNGYVTSYCTAGTTVHGCVPWIASEGAPNSTAASGFDIVVHAVEGGKMGLIYYGFYPAAVPWAVGSQSYRCVAYPVQRTGARNSGGTLGSCNGELRIDFNAWMQANPLGLGYPFVQGQVFYAQGWFRDSGAPKGTNLSNGLRFTLCN